MKFNIDCGGESSSKCNLEPVIIDGFEAFAPDFARLNSGFNPKYFVDLANIEAGNFWFNSRNSLIIWALEKYTPNLTTFMEIGCGTGFVLRGIAERFSKVKLTGSEIYVNGLHFAKQRVSEARLIQMDARKIPFIQEFDVIGAFDVIEHIDDDVQVLKQLHKALNDSGIIILTVPQHRWLWSDVDDCACHVRRYDSQDLHEKVCCAGFDILCSTSFVSILLPAMLVSRFMKRGKQANNLNELDGLRISSWLNRLLLIVMKIEITMIRIGISFPLGGSRLVVARKI